MDGCNVKQLWWAWHFYFLKMKNILNFWTVVYLIICYWKFNGSIKERNQKNKFHKITDNKNVYCIHKVHYENINL